MQHKHLKIDVAMMVIPIIAIIILCGLFEIFPHQSQVILRTVRDFLGNNFGSYYILMALTFFISSLYVAFSKYGHVKLGAINDQPQYSNFHWGMLIFTSTMSADIIFYSLSEWMMYGQTKFIQHQVGGMQKWALTYSLFHWGPLAWSFYIMLAVAFGYMLYARKNAKQKFSEACRPLLGKAVDGIAGKLIDLLAIFALIAGTSTSFSVSMPLLADALIKLCHWPANYAKMLSVIMLLVVVCVYTLVILRGVKGIAKLAQVCTWCFGAFLLYCFLCSGHQRYIIEAGIQSLGNMLQNFIGMATTTDPLRHYTFTQAYTIYYWSYWMVWCVATPFFIGSISKGRTIKNVVLGGYGWGLAGTYTAFIVLTNYGMAQQFFNHLQIFKFLQHHTYAQAIIHILMTLPWHQIALVLLIITMVGLYATVFDAITMVVSSYSYQALPANQTPGKPMRVFWAIVFILLPITLLLTGNSIFDLQSVAIIAAFPIGIVMLIILISFYKAIRKSN